MYQEGHTGLVILVSMRSVQMSSITKTTREKRLSTSFHTIGSQTFNLGIVLNLTISLKIK